MKFRTTASIKKGTGKVLYLAICPSGSLAPKLETRSAFSRAMSFSRKDKTGELFYLLFAESKIEKLICNSRETLQHFNLLKRFKFTQVEGVEAPLIFLYVD
jgi:hypothetical protein